MRVLKIGSDIQVILGEPDPESSGPGNIQPMRHPYVLSSCHMESGLPRETCSHCGQPDCCYQCVGSVAGGLTASDESYDGDSEETVAGRLKSNGALDGIEALILACAAAGFDVESPAFVEAVETAVQSAANNL